MDGSQEIEISGNIPEDRKVAPSEQLGYPDEKIARQLDSLCGNFANLSKSDLGLFEFNDMPLKRLAGIFGRPDQNIKELCGKLGALGRDARKNSVQAKQVIDYLEEQTLNLADGGTRPVSKNLALTIWRLSNYLDSEKQKKIMLIKGGIVFATFVVTGGVLAIRDRVDDVDLQPTVAVTVTMDPDSNTDMATKKPTRMPKPTQTPELIKTPSPEKAAAKEWQEIEKDYGSKSLASRVVEDGDVTDAIGFKERVSQFLDKYDMLKGNEAVDYNPSEDSEVYLWAEKDDDGGIRVRFDGPFMPPSYVAKTFYYNQEEGVCAAVADEPLSDGSWQSNEIKFDPDKPQICIATALTKASIKIIVGFFPQDSGEVQVKVVMVNEYQYE